MNELRSVFENHGAVDSVKIVMDRDTGRSKGFGFVEMPNDSEARTAIEQLHGVELQERSITVNSASPRAPFEQRRRLPAAIAGNRLTSVIHEKGAHCDGRLFFPAATAGAPERQACVRGAPSEDAMSPHGDWLRSALAAPEAIRRDPCGRRAVAGSFPPGSMTTTR